MGKSKVRKQDLYWLIGYGIFFSLAGYLAAEGLFAEFNEKYPYLAGVIQFVLFATGGELLSTRILYNYWPVDKAMGFKALVWGMGGLVLTVLFSVLPKGVEATMETGLLPFYGSDIAAAVLSSIVLNLFSMPIHAAAMRILGNYSEERFYHGHRMKAIEAVDSVDWGEFVDFTYFKTIPVFWIPANTIGFLMPENFRVFFAAVLSFVFGMLMTILKLREKRRERMIV